MKKWIHIVGFVLTFCMALSGCRSVTEKPSEEFVKNLNRTKGPVHDMLAYGMAYREFRKESFNIGEDYINGKPTRFVKEAYADRPVFFFENGLLLAVGVRFVDSVTFAPWMKRSVQKSFSDWWGVYTISGNKISAIVYGAYETNSVFRHVKMMQTRFEGQIATDTIKDWHLVRPYPKEAGEFASNRSYIAKLAMPKNLYLKRIDTTGLVEERNAWIFELLANQDKQKKLSK